MVEVIESRSGAGVSANVNALIWFLSPNAKVLQIESWKILTADMEPFLDGKMRMISFMEGPVSRSGKNLSPLLLLLGSRAELMLEENRELAIYTVRGNVQ
jgi:hypothetical protein